jgi:CRP-like cAMP-binding protein/zinc transporter ZupT
MENVVVSAFIMGIVSASSLPLGTLTTAIWKPGERMVAFLMAFGAGALLAALTLDLVGVALARNEFYSLAVGMLAGGALFAVLNQLVNNQGGFLRKSSTAIFHIRRERQLRTRHIVRHMGHIETFRNLTEREVRDLGDVLFRQEFPAGTTLYRLHDPCDRLYIVERGEVELLDPDKGMAPFRLNEKNDAFGRMAFFTGSPHATVARTRTEVTVWVLARDDFKRLLVTMPSLEDALVDLIGGQEVRTYLLERQGLKPEQVDDWVTEAIASLRGNGTIPPAVKLNRPDESRRELIQDVGSALIFDDLPEDALRSVVNRLFRRTVERGETLFQRGQLAERMYIIEEGEVALVDPQNELKPAEKLFDGDAMGGLDFVTGARYSQSAVATMDTTVWVLRKRDFEQLLRQSPLLEEKVRELVQAENVARYLKERHEFNADDAARWVRHAVRNLENGRPVRSVADFAEKIKEHAGAPIAIWLGIMLDGIPESMVIGSSMLHSPLSLSLLAGLFLSNYPEALSSSMGMRQQGLSFRRVLFMWTSLMVLTGIGAALGNLFFTGTSLTAVSLIQGLAAGAMLTMIAETMLPEAYTKGGSVIGLATLAGFLAAIFFKTLE